MKLDIIFKKLEAKATGAEISRRLGISPQVYANWKKRGVPAEWVLPLEEVTGVSRHTIRPDIYPVDNGYIRGRTA